MCHYNCNYKKEEIKNILNKIHCLIKNNKFTISLGENRQDNMSFIEDYNLTSDKQIKILLDIKVEDFCYSLQNTKPGYEYEVLYVFGPKITLYDINDEVEDIQIYVKFNLLEDIVVTISFHKANKELHYLFK